MTTAARIAVAAPLSAVVLAAVVLLAACDRDKASQETARPAAGIATVTVRADARALRSWDGVVQAVQHTTLSSQTSGRVLSVHADIDDTVREGQVLVRITEVEQRAGASAARAQLRAAEAAALEAESRYRRYSALAPQQYVSREQLQQARADRDAAVAARDAARAQLEQAGQQADYTTVRAPYSGIVSARLVEPGQAVAPGTGLISMYAPGATRIELALPQAEADVLKRNEKQARIHLEDGRHLVPSSVVVYPAADPASHSVVVRVLLPSIDPLPKPGSIAKVEFPGEAGPPVPHVPESVLVQRGEVSAVYVVADGRISLRQVRLGHRDEDGVEVLAGLKAGERIAADPVAATRALAAQRAKEQEGREAP